MRQAIAVIIVLAAMRPAMADPRPTRLRVDVSTARALAPSAVSVDDGARVVVEIGKNVFHACVVTSKVEPLPAPADPVAQILAVLSGIPGLPTALRMESDKPAPTPPRGAEPLHQQLNDLLLDITAVNEDLRGQLDEIRQRAESLPGWVACDRAGTCADVDAARSRLDRLAAAIQRTPSHPIASVAVSSARAAELLKNLNAMVDRPSEDAGVWLHWAFTRVGAIQELADVASERRQFAVKGRDALLAVRERILTFQPATRMEEPLTPQVNARSVVTVACANVVTQQPAVYALDGERVVTERIAPVSVSIAYRSAPRATVSAGVLYSLVDRRKIGIAPHRTGVEDGVITYDRQIVETDRFASQVVPFSFVNVIAPGARRRAVAPALSLGVGLNPNNGATVVEYFAGGSLAVGRVGIQIGAHIGTRLEPAEQFAIGDVLPDRLATVPTARRRATAFGVGLSYALGVK